MQDSYVRVLAHKAPIDSLEMQACNSIAPVPPNASDLEGNWINQAGAPLIELEARTSKLAAAAPQFLHMLNVI